MLENFEKENRSDVNGNPTGGSKISEMIAGIRSSLDELEAAVASEEQQPGEPIEGEPMKEEDPMVPPMKKKSALDRFAGM